MNRKIMVISMRLLAFSDWRVQKIDDIFSFAQDLEDPVDFILYGGDDIGRFEEEGVNYFTELSRYAKQGMVLAVIGNDDFPEVKRVLKSKNVQDLYEEPFVFQDFAFIGLEASTSGPAIIKHTEKEVKEHLKKQHSEVRGKKLIILSHTPPYGILDLGIRFAELDEGSHHIGSTSLRNFVQQNKVNLVICGHCHSHGGLSTQFLDTTIVNVSSHDSPGAKGNFALIEIDSKGQVSIEWHDTFERLKGSSLMRLHSVGAVREEMFHDLGIKTIKDLAEVQDLSKIAKKSSFSVNFLRKLRLRAKSVSENRTYQIAPFALPDGDLIFFDIETDIACERVWLIGVLKEGRFTRFYADNWKQERKILRHFLHFLEENPDSYLVSSSGTGFDKNVIQRALNRLRMGSDIFSSYPHVDLCQALRRSFIFPNQSFALKDLGTYLKYPFKHPDLDGFFVALEYQQHVNEKRPLDPKVLEYNEDDVKVLAFIVEKVIKGEFEVQKEFLQEAYPIEVEREVSEEIEKEIDILRKLRSEGYTLQELADKFNRSIYYIYSRLSSKYRPWKAYKPLKRSLDKNELILMVRECYEKSGNVSIRKDKRYNSYNAEIRFYGKSLKELNPLRNAIANLGFSEGSPYQYQNKRRCYIPYYGKEQVIRFIKMVKPRTKNDISKLR